ncbi:MAG: Smr/MutS family protein, partial [Evtepia gabavorous]
MRKKAQKELDWQAVNDQRAGLRHRLNEAEDKLGVREKAAPPPMLRPAQKGDTVTILKTGTQGTVLSVNKDGVLQLQAGILRITAKQEEVRVVEGETRHKRPPASIQRTEHKLRSLGAKAEVDLRGMTTDEAEMTLSQFLDRAIMGNLTQVTVIHGKGTGAVRKAVHTYLKRCKGVASFRLGRYGEGEDGVTIVALK